MAENGVGSVAQFMSAFREGLPSVPRLEGRRVRILTGASMAPFLEELAPSLRGATGAEVQVRTIENLFFGESVTVAGLLAGEDLLSGAEGARADELILLPKEALNADELFIDSMSLSEFREAVAPAKVLVGLEITEVLRSL